MDFVENVKDVISNAAQTVAEKSGEILEKSKVQYSIFDLNNDIKKLYTEIGRLAYQTFKTDDDNSDEIKMKCEIISAKLAKIEVLKNNPSSVGFKCPSCGRKTDGADNYCPSCGASMTVDVDVDIDVDGVNNSDNGGEE